jgi:hypothetical protein
MNDTQKVKTAGRPCFRGRRRRRPKLVVRDGGLELSTVKTYGRNDQQVHLKTASEHWYKMAFGRITVQWVFVRNEVESLRDEYTLCTQSGLRTPAVIVSFYKQRWTIGVAFRKLRTHLECETPRQRIETSAQRMTPMLLGVFRQVSVMCHSWLIDQEQVVKSCPWYDIMGPNFSGVLETICREPWEQPQGDCAMMGNLQD